ncbi:MAG: bifunctional (p)ppGpp synthetase/guanosine-3',5'-bis(diphosphate) 3'-pyrophosphohydrolase, partial [Gammaproteobacteria bacterium]
PLNASLHTADQVSVLTGKQESPSRDWLSPALGYLHTARARAKVQQWFRKQNHEKNALAGKAMLERELRQLNLGHVNLEPFAEKFNKHGEDGLYAAVGAGDIGVVQVINAVLSTLDLGKKQESPRIFTPPKASRYEQSDIYIYGVGNLLTHIARCCNPIPGDQISGYITSGRGVSIHRKDCGNLLRLQKSEPERVLEVSWGGKPKQVYPVRIGIDSYDRGGLLRDVSIILDKAGLNVLAMSSRSDEGRRGVSVRMEITAEVASFDELSGVMSRLRQIPNVINVQRLDDA